MTQVQAQEMKRGAFGAGVRRGGVAARFNRRRFTLDIDQYPEGKERYVKLSELPLADDKGAGNQTFDRIFVIEGAFLSNRGKFENRFTGDTTTAALAVCGYFDVDGDNGQTDFIPYFRFVNIPPHSVPIVQEIIEDESAVDAINAHTFGFRPYAYMDKKFNRRCYGLNFVDVFNVESDAPDVVDGVEMPF